MNLYLPKHSKPFRWKRSLNGGYCWSPSQARIVRFQPNELIEIFRPDPVDPGLLEILNRYMRGDLPPQARVRQSALDYVRAGSSHGLGLGCSIKNG